MRNCAHLLHTGARCSDFPSFSGGLSLRGFAVDTCQTADADFPSFFGGTFIEAGRRCARPVPVHAHFPSFLEGLSLRLANVTAHSPAVDDFPSFWEGLSLRRELHGFCAVAAQYFPSFSGGLSLRFSATRFSTWQRLKISLLFRREFH